MNLKKIKSGLKLYPRKKSSNGIRNSNQLTHTFVVYTHDGQPGYCWRCPGIYVITDCLNKKVARTQALKVIRKCETIANIERISKLDKNPRATIMQFASFDYGWVPGNNNPQGDELIRKKIKS